MANPYLEEPERIELVKRLMAARRAVRDAKKTADRDAEAKLMAPSRKSSAHSASAALYGGMMVRRTSTGTWQKTRLMPVGTRAFDGAETQDLPDVAGLLRSGDRRAFHEGGAASMGRRQQSLPSRRREGKRRCGRDRRDHGEAGCRAEAAGRQQRTFRRTRGSTHGSRPRRQAVGRDPQVAGAQAPRPLFPPTQPPIARPHLPTNARKNSALASERSETPQRNERGNAARRLSTRPRAISMRPSASMPKRPRRSMPSARQSRRSRGPRMLDGKRSAIG
jgi:hypothetical protein